MGGERRKLERTGREGGGRPRVMQRTLLISAILAAAAIFVVLQQSVPRASPTALLHGYLLRGHGQAPPAVAAAGADATPDRQRTLMQQQASRAVPSRRSAAHVKAGGAKKHKARRATKVISGKAIFARMTAVLGKMARAQRKTQEKTAPLPPALLLGKQHGAAAKAFKQALALQSLAAETVDEETGEIDVNDDPIAETVYVYRGRETKTKTDELVTFILAGGFGIPDVKYIESSSDAEMRKALWDEDCRAVIFPPLKDIPDFGPNAVKDMRAFVSHGMHHSGTMLFMGSSVEIHLINNIFGYELEQVHPPTSPLHQVYACNDLSLRTSSTLHVKQDDHLPNRPPTHEPSQPATEHQPPNPQTPTPNPDPENPTRTAKPTRTRQDYKPGPYYKNERAVLQTALAPLPGRVNELGNTEALGILKSSMPPEARSYYDSFGDSVAMCVRYDLGRVCYLAQDFNPLMRMPELQLELFGQAEDHYGAIPCNHLRMAFPSLKSRLTL